MPVHNLIYCMLAFCWPLLGPFCLLLPCVALPTFGTLCSLLQPCGHVWGLTMRKCAPRGLERMFPFLMCSCFTSLAPRCSQCLLELCSTLSLLIAALARLFPFCSAGEWFFGWFRVVLLRGLPRCVFGPFLCLAHFTSTLSLSVSLVSLSMIV